MSSRPSSEARPYTQSLKDFKAEFQQLPEVEQVSCTMSDLTPLNRLITLVESDSSFQARTLNTSLIYLFFPTKKHLIHQKIYLVLPQNKPQICLATLQICLTIPQICLATPQICLPI